MTGNDNATNQTVDIEVWTRFQLSDDSLSLYREIVILADKEVNVNRVLVNIQILIGFERKLMHLV